MALSSHWFTVLVVLIAWNEFCNSLVSEEHIKALQKVVRRSCKKKLQITDDGELDGVLDGEWDNLSQDTKCYLHCCLKMGKLIKSDGHFDYEYLTRFIPNLLPERRDATEITIETCKYAGNDLTDKCEIAYELCKCFYFSNPEYYVIP